MVVAVVDLVASEALSTLLALKIEGAGDKFPVQSLPLDFLRS